MVPTATTRNTAAARQNERREAARTGAALRAAGAGPAHRRDDQEGLPIVLRGARSRVAGMRPSIWGNLLKWYHHIDGLSVTCHGGYMSFMLIGGRPALDYVGTLRSRRGPEPLEYLAEPSDVAEWAAASGLVDQPFSVTPAQLAAAREIREVIYRVISGRIAGRAPTGSDVAALNAASQRPPVAILLYADGSVRRVGTAAQLLSTVARDALDLLGSGQIGLVRECDGPTCTRLYVDTSRARNRRWCSNTECGNQAKVTAFRRRARTPAGSEERSRASHPHRQMPAEVTAEMRRGEAARST